MGPGDDELDGWRSLLEVNLLGPLLYTRALLPLLGASGRGSVVYLTSIDGLRGNPAFPAYSVSKGGLIPLAHVMAHDCASVGLRVNAVAVAGMVPAGTGPAPVEAPPAMRTSIMAATPLHRPPQAEEIASVILFLASSDSSYVTGAVLPVDGGRLAITPGTGVGVGGI